MAAHTSLMTPNIRPLALSWALLAPLMEHLPGGPDHHPILFAAAALLTGSVIVNSFDIANNSPPA
jgi:hypothetical protein